MIVDGQIRCGHCGESNPLSDFCPSIQRNGCGYCKECSNQNRTGAPKKRRARDPEKAKAYARKYRERKIAEYKANPIVDGTIRCSTCKSEKHVSEYSPAVVAIGCGVCRKCKYEAKRRYEAKNPGRAAAARREWRSRNKERATTYMREYQRSNPERLREYNLKRYGLTSEGYESMLAEQGGACSCCGAKANGDGRRLYVDHDHETGFVRGVICHRCNAGIGGLGDSIEGVSRALEYLKNNTFAPHRASVRINLLGQR